MSAHHEPCQAPTAAGTPAGGPNPLKALSSTAGIFGVGLFPENSDE
jgi:hypothetical protein